MINTVVNEGNSTLFCMIEEGLTPRDAVASLVTENAKLKMVTEMEWFSKKPNIGVFGIDAC